MSKNLKNKIKNFEPKLLNIRDFELRQTIGKGDHSIIKLAKATQSNKFFAIKKIKKSINLDVQKKSTKAKKIFS